VAAHLDPEILVVDEVLAVGDVEFQKKCLGKMGEVTGEGRTVLFVSHNMAAVVQLCSRGILLENGKERESGYANEVVGHYLSTGSEKLDTVDLTNYKLRQGTKDVMFEWAQLRNSDQKACWKISVGDDIIITFGMKSVRNYLNQRIKVAIEMRTSDGIRLCNMVDVDSGFQVEHLSQTEVLSVCMKDIRLYPGVYYISLWVGSVTSTETFDHVEDCLGFEIIDGGKLTTRWLPRSDGLLFLTPEWKREEYISQLVSVE
jgi:lipopolysaccharide transport system ATP-binding protein